MLHLLFKEVSPKGNTPAFVSGRGHARESLHLDFQQTTAEATMSLSRRSFGLAGTLLLGGGLLAAATASNAEAAGCQLKSAGGQIKHVVYITFDNVHLRRDNPNVPSDMELMPNLLNFILDNGTISGNHHTPLISHTTDDIITALTGVYGDRHGIAVSNSYGAYQSNGTVRNQSAFTYWTTIGADGKPNLLAETGKNAPAPWVPFTRAGCDVGAFSIANMEFESIPSDVSAFFGANSTQVQAINGILANNANDNTFAHQQARQSINTDWLGIAVHCAAGSPLCSGANGAPDALPDEPGGYTGFNGLFGNVNVGPAVCAKATAVNSAACAPTSRIDYGPNGTGTGTVSVPAVQDVFGTSIIADAYGRPGFPNVFDPTAAESLGYAATMLEAGLPVVYLYIEDLHDQQVSTLDPTTNRLVSGRAFGPGEAGYVAQAQAYDKAFGAFFKRLAKDGITKENTLFLVIPDENDHFVGAPPTTPNCDGVHVPCSYDLTKLGEVDAFLNRLLITQFNNTTSFFLHFDDAPNLYLTGTATNPTGPAQTDPVTRTMEQNLNALTLLSPITGNTDKASVFLADQAEMKMLHMITASPARTPTITMFGDDDYFFETSSSTANCSLAPACLVENDGFAWNHGDVQEQITRTWMGMVGPGVRHQGRDDSVFSDHTDVRPTMLALVGLKDDYVHDGRVLAEKLHDWALPDGIADRTEDFVELATVYKQLNATLGPVGLNSLKYANRSITSDDATYAKYLATIGPITTARDALATQIKNALDAAAFAKQPINERTEDGLGAQARKIIDQVEDLAGGDHDHDHGHDHDHDHDHDGDHH